jgi:DNA-binding transcriptional ArsR family regulator
MDHPRRRQLLACLSAHEGLGPREVARATNIPLTTTLHHLALLKRHGLIQEEKIGSRRLFRATSHLALDLDSTTRMEPSHPARPRTRPVFPPNRVHGLTPQIARCHP